jgi:hypothetical protein
MLSDPSLSRFEALPVFGERLVTLRLLLLFDLELDAVLLAETDVRVPVALVLLELAEALLVLRVRALRVRVALEVRVVRAVPIGRCRGGDRVPLKGSGLFGHDVLLVFGVRIPAPGRHGRVGAGESAS